MEHQPRERHQPAQQPEGAEPGRPGKGGAKPDQEHASAIHRHQVPRRGRRLGVEDGEACGPDREAQVGGTPLARRRGPEGSPSPSPPPGAPPGAGRDRQPAPPPGERASSRTAARPRPSVRAGTARSLRSAATPPLLAPCCRGRGRWPGPRARPISARRGGPRQAEQQRQEIVPGGDEGDRLRWRGCTGQQQGGHQRRRHGAKETERHEEEQHGAARVQHQVHRM
jgi:hypothetical protein